MPKPARDPAREQFWRHAIADQQASGRTVRDFCRDRQLAETSFHHWRRELRQRDAAAAPRTAPPAFVPVTVVPGPSAPNTTCTPNAIIEVRCPSGHVVSVTGIPLCELFAALDSATEAPPC
jgi:transposase-like protein